jgi:hypothetical protein
METPAGSLSSVVADGTVLELTLLLQGGANANAAAPGGMVPLVIAAARGRLEVCAMLLDAGADPNARTARGSTARDVAAVGGKVTVANFLGVVAKMLAEGHELSPGHSYLEIARLVRAKENVGTSCPRCGTSVPAAGVNDHLYSHAWEVEVKQGAVTRGSASAARVTTPPGVVPAGKVAVFSGRMGDLAVTAACVEITGFGITGNTDVIPLDSIQSINISGLVWKHLDIHTAGYCHQWESGLDARKAEEVRRFILGARAALLAGRAR